MPSTELRGVLRACLALILVSGCGPAVSPGPATAVPTPSASGPAATATPLPATTPATAAPTPAVAADPGQPYDAAAILDAMRASRRPGGVPDQLETDAIAVAVAEQIWTFDGDAWASMSVGGSCGPSSCTVEVGGTPAGALGEDLYVMEVTPSTGSVQVAEASLHGLSQDVVDRLDEAARAAWDGPELDELALASAGWRAPPHASEFVLSYRSGGEEGAPSIDLVLDVESGTVTQH